MKNNEQGDRYIEFAYRENDSSLLKIEKLSMSYAVIGF